MILQATAFLLPVTLVAACYDVKERRIPNLLTYSAATMLLACSAATAAPIPIEEALAGLAGCFGTMLMAYLFFGVGAGDVKLAAVLGAGLGVRLGLEAIIWAHLLGAVFCCLMVIYRTGPIWLLKQLLACLGVRVQLGPDYSEVFKYPVPMGVFLALGTMLTMSGVHLL